MPRLARIVVPGIAHHITQRGNNQQDVFFVDQDKKEYLSLLKKHSLEFGFQVLGYCLMTNHVHIVGVPDAEESLAKAIGRTNFIYTQYVNRMHGRSGHLWQNRFYSCALDDRYFWTALRYTEINPVRARMVRFPWRYPWSSAPAHIGQGEKSGLIDLKHWEKLSEGLDWKDFLRDGIDDDLSKSFQIHYRRGRPLGSDRFISKLEVRLGRRLRPSPGGRPKKKVKKKKKLGDCPHVYLVLSAIPTNTPPAAWMCWITAASKSNTTVIDIMIIIRDDG